MLSAKDAESTDGPRMSSGGEGATSVVRALVYANVVTADEQVRLALRGLEGLEPEPWLVDTLKHIRYLLQECSMAVYGGPGA